MLTQLRFQFADALALGQDQRLGCDPSSSPDLRQQGRFDRVHEPGYTESRPVLQPRSQGGPERLHLWLHKPRSDSVPFTVSNRGDGMDYIGAERD